MDTIDRRTIGNMKMYDGPCGLATTPYIHLCRRMARVPTNAGVESLNKQEPMKEYWLLKNSCNKNLIFPEHHIQLTDTQESMISLLFCLFAIIASTSAQFNWGVQPYVPVTQLPQGSLDGWVFNGRGGLGRYQRHSERRDNRGYYGNGDFNYNAPLVFQPLYGR